MVMRRQCAITLHNCPPRRRWYTFGRGSVCQSVARSALKHGPSHHPLATHAGGDARLQSTSKRHAVAVGWTPTNWDTVVGANCQVGAQSPTFVTACCIHGMHCSLSDECHLSYDNPRVSDIKPTYLHIPVFAFAQVFPCRGLCLLRLL